MKTTLVCIAFVAAFATLQAAPSGSDPFNHEENLKKVADVIGDWSKKFEESTGVHTEFDKEKFLKAGKSVLEKATEVQAKLKESLDTSLKNLPASEELKKKIEEAQKQVSETLKNFNTPEVQKSAEKLRDTFAASAKKLGESLNELAQKFGVAPPPSVQKTLNELNEEFTKFVKVAQEKGAKLVEDAQNELKKKKN